MIIQHALLRNKRGTLVHQVMIMERSISTGRVQYPTSGISWGRSFAAARDLAFKLYKLDVARHRPAPVKPGGRHRLMLRWRRR